MLGQFIMEHWNRQSGQTIGSTTYVRPVKVPCVECVEKKGESVQHITSG